MKIKMNYGNSVGVFPLSSLEVINRAKLVDLKIFMFLCSQNGEFSPKEISKAVGCTENQFSLSLSFWRGAGVIDIDEETAEENAGETAQLTPKSTEKKTTKLEQQPTPQDHKKVESKKLSREDKLPSYTSDELATVLENRHDTRMLIEACQNVIGKIFSIREINIIIGLVDYLGLDNEYILVLTTHCVGIGKKTLHYIEKTAFSLYDDGIIEAKILSQELKRRENLASNESKIKKIFGLGTRAFTSREKKEVLSWLEDMKFPFDVVQKAYEITVDATGNNSLHYAHTVLSRWHGEGLKSLEDIQNFDSKNRVDKLDPATQNGSFNTDEFFEAAIRRSLGE